MCPKPSREMTTTLCTLLSFSSSPVLAAKELLNRRRKKSAGDMFITMGNLKNGGEHVNKEKNRDHRPNVLFFPLLLTPVRVSVANEGFKTLF